MVGAHQGLVRVLTVRRGARQGLVQAIALSIRHAAEHAANAPADGHVVAAPLGREQHPPVEIGHRALGKAQQQVALPLTNNRLQATAHRDAREKVQRHRGANRDSMNFQLVDGVFRQAAAEVGQQTHRRAKAVAMSGDAVPVQFAPAPGELGRSARAQVGRIAHRIADHLVEHAADLHPGVVLGGANGGGVDGLAQRRRAALAERHGRRKFLKHLVHVFTATGNE